MATTTAMTIRNTIAGLIEDISPSIHRQQKLRRHTEQLALRPWAEANPAACLRVFSVRFEGSTEPPAVNDTLVQEVRDTIEIVVAYPLDWRHGGGQTGQLLALDDVIADDARLIERTVGPPGYATLAGLVAPACVMWEQANARDSGEFVAFSVLRYRCDYFRSLS